MIYAVEKKQKIKSGTPVPLIHDIYGTFREWKLRYETWCVTASGQIVCECKSKQRAEQICAALNAVQERQ